MQGAVFTQQAEKLHWEVRADREKMAFDQRRKKEVEVLSELMLHIFEVNHHGLDSNMFHTEITIILTMYENIYISVFKFLYTVHIQQINIVVYLEFVSSSVFCSLPTCFRFFSC